MVDEDHDNRLQSVGAAVEFAKDNNLLGVFVDAELLVSSSLSSEVANIHANLLPDHSLVPSSFSNRRYAKFGAHSRRPRESISPRFPQARGRARAHSH
jgi:hypothetical protein